jgi:hypothetical protein
MRQFIKLVYMDNSELICPLFYNNQINTWVRLDPSGRLTLIQPEEEWEEDTISDIIDL